MTSILTNGSAMTALSTLRRIGAQLSSASQQMSSLTSDIEFSMPPY
ncbi:hypothetical protein [Agrobacterium sp. NPDC089420]